MKILISILSVLIAHMAFAQNAQYDAYIRDGIDLTKRNKYSLAEEQFKKAIEVDTNNVKAYYELGQTYSHYYSQAGTNSDLSIFYLNKALVKDSTYKNVRAALGHIKGLMHDFEAALKEFNIAIATKPDSNTYLARALIKFKLNDTDGVCNDLYEAIKLGSEMSRRVISERMLKVNCDAIELTQPKEILLRAYNEMMARSSVEYDAQCTRYTSVDDRKMSFHGKVFLKKPTHDTVEGFYFWIAQSDSTYFFSDMHHTYGNNKNRNACTVYDAYYFLVHFIVGSSHSQMGELIWTSFASPAKIKEKLTPPINLESKTDTTVDGIDCYRVLVKYPDDSQSSDHELMMCFNKKDFAPIYLSTKSKHEGIIYFDNVSFKNYIFDKVDYSRFSPTQIPENYKIHVYDPERDK